MTKHRQEMYKTNTHETVYIHNVCRKGYDRDGKVGELPHKTTHFVELKLYQVK